MKINQMNVSGTKIQLSDWKEKIGRVACFIAFVSSFGACAATLVSGNISGDWTLSGSPYNVIDNCTVPQGQALVIHPGVTVVIGSNLTVTVNGQIRAIGTPAQKIKIRGAQPTVRWATLKVVHGDGTQSAFDYCDFSDAETGLSLDIEAQNATMQTEISHCTFSNCVTCLYGRSHGYGYNPNYQTTVYLEPHLNPNISNCRFLNSSTDCLFYMDGTLFADWYDVYTLYARGYAAPSIANCTFESASGTGIYLQAGSTAGTSSPSLVNCVKTQNQYGVQTSDPYDLNVRNCIFEGCGVAMARSGASSSQIGYNCFFSNQTNFIGYPASFGQVVSLNNNGTACDIALNIFQNPSFLNSSDYLLTSNSPCIDAGDPSAAYLDGCLPPSLGI